MIFLDSNILVYASGINGLADPRTAVARKIVEADEPYAVSVQVLQEFYDRVTRPRRDEPCLTREDTLEFLAQWRTFRVEPLSLDLFDRAIEIEARFGYRYWDCAILAAAQLAGCHTLLTEDLQHDQRVGSVRIVNPFTPE